MQVHVMVVEVLVVFLLYEVIANIFSDYPIV